VVTSLFFLFFSFYPLILVFSGLPSFIRGCGRFVFEFEGHQGGERVGIWRMGYMETHSAKASQDLPCMGNAPLIQ